MAGLVKHHNQQGCSSRFPENACICLSYIKHVSTMVFGNNKSRIFGKFTKSSKSKKDPCLAGQIFLFARVAKFTAWVQAAPESQRGTDQLLTVTVSSRRPINLSRIVSNFVLYSPSWFSLIPIGVMDPALKVLGVTPGFRFWCGCGTTW